MHSFHLSHRVVQNWLRLIRWSEYVLVVRVLLLPLQLVVKVLPLPPQLVARGLPLPLAQVVVKWLYFYCCAVAASSALLVLAPSTMCPF